MQVQQISIFDLQVGDLFMDSQVNGICLCEGETQPMKDSNHYQIIAQQIETPWYSIYSKGFRTNSLLPEEYENRINSHIPGTNYFIRSKVDIVFKIIFNN